jgi:hypothetical protein
MSPSIFVESSLLNDQRIRFKFLGLRSIRSKLDRYRSQIPRSLLHRLNHRYLGKDSGGLMRATHPEVVLNQKQ